MPQFVDIQKYKPEDIWLELLLLDPHGNVRIMGRSESKSSVASFTQQLKDKLKDRFKEDGQPQLLGFDTVYDDQLKKEVQKFDIVIVGEHKLSQKVFYALKDAFEESELPIKVDVLDWHRISCEFQNNIKAQYEPIYP